MDYSKLSDQERINALLFHKLITNRYLPNNWQQLLHTINVQPGNAVAPELIDLYIATHLYGLNIEIPNKVVLNEDFHNYCNSTRQKFGLVIGNPPYIRYQYFDKEQQLEAEKISDLFYREQVDLIVAVPVNYTLDSVIIKLLRKLNRNMGNKEGKLKN
jgi:hypothetical protein